MKTRITFFMSALLLCATLGWGQTVVDESITDPSTNQPTSLTWSLNNGTLTISNPSGVSKAMPDWNSTNRPWENYRESIHAVIVGDGITSIGAHAFFNMPNLVSATISNNVTTIANSVFQHCRNLTSATIPSGLLYIGDFAFLNCEKLGSISIPAGVTYIGEIAFVNCYNMEAFNVASANNSYSSEGGVLYDKNKTILIAYPSKKSDNSFIIPNTVTVIGKIAFDYCENLGSLVIPSSVDSIGERAFNIPNLMNISIPASVRRIGEEPFSNGHKFTSIDVEPANEYYSSEDGVLYDKGKNILITYPEAKSNTTISIPNTVKRIKSRAFQNATNITSITIPSSTTCIEEGAFNSCIRLASVTLPSLLDSIGDYAFAYCEALDAVEIKRATPPNIGTDVFTGIKTNAKLVVPAGAVAAYASWSSYFGGGITAAPAPDDSGIFGTSLRWEMYFADSTLVFKNTGNTPEPMPDYTQYIDIAWSKYFERVNAVVIGDGITRIGQSAFSNFQQMTSIAISNSVTSIGTAAFGGCIKLTSITIPSQITTIDKDAFGYCFSLSINVEAGNANYSSENGILYDKEKKLLHTYPASISDTAFIVPNTVTTIGYAAFRGNSHITSIIIPEGVKIIGEIAFFDNDKLAYVALPASLDTIGAANFYNSRLSLIEIKRATPPYIGTDVFKNVYAGSSININAKLVVPVGVEAAYASWSSYFGGGIIGADYSELIKGTSLIWTLVGSKLTISGTGDIPDYYSESLPAPWLLYVIQNNALIDSLVIEEGVTRIGSEAFAGLKLADVQIQLPAHLLSDVQSIGNGAFMNCQNLTSMTIPNGVTAIGAYAFRNCKNLAFVTMKSATPPDIGADVFTGIKTNAKLVVPAGAKAAYASWSSYFGGGIVEADYSEVIKGTSLIWTLADSKLTISGTGDIPDYPDALSTPWRIYAIQNNALIDSLVIEGGVTRIGNYAFSELKLVDVQIQHAPDGIKSIGDRAFINCSKLTSITIPDGVTSIEGYAFTGCNNLAFVTIPDGVTSIEEGTFFGCYRLVSVTIPNSVTSIGYGAFDACIDLPSVTIPNSVTAIGAWAFHSCYSLASVTIPNSVTIIEERTFHNCTSLASITIPNSVTSIRYEAFAAGESLKDVTVQWPNPLSITGNVFEEVDLAAATLHVPAGTTALYKAADVWKDFGTIVEQSVAAEEVAPVVIGNGGSIELSLNLPTDATLTGSFIIKLPEGMTLDKAKTKLVGALANILKLAFQELVNNTWTITIEMNSTTRSLLRDATAYTKIMDIAYTVDESISNGNYTIQLSDMDFDLKESDGTTSTIHEESLPVTVQVDRTAAIGVTGVTLNQTALAAAPGDAPVTLVATIAPADATTKDVIWSTSNAAVATVSNNGTVTFVSVGTAVITVTTNDGGKTATCTVTVTAPTDPTNPTDPTIAVTGVSLSHTTLAGKAGDAAVELIATITPSNATTTDVTWSTSNASVATVDNGTVNFIGAGTATITVTTVDGSYTATCVVTVSTATGTEGTDAALKVYFSDYTLYICSPAAETVEVYSFSGTRIFSAKKDAGEATFTVPASDKAVIVRGSSGWVQKAVVPNN